MLGAPCLALSAGLTHVAIDPEPLEAFAAELALDPPPLPTWDHPAIPDEAGPLLDAVVWLGNALNFCYWTPAGEPMWSIAWAGERHDDAMGIFSALRRAAAEGADLSDGRFLADETDDGPPRIFRPGAGVLPLLGRRIEILREIGRALVRDFRGRLERAVEAAGPDAPGMARFLARTFPSFRDERTYRGVSLPFLKRAQLAAGMLHARRVALGAPGLTGTGRLTVYADYMLPRALRAKGVLRYAPGLARRVDAAETLEAGGEEEAEIRIATVAASESLVRQARGRGADIDGLRLDYRLWERGFSAAGEHHRTICTDY